ncbi:MAG TPA: SpoIIE family protein phosphatase, partial [Rhodothermales bacterium]|nr:SpoIIE family protein phosphatase [Rhodothermales bacterium]
HPARFWIALTDGRVFTFDPRNGQYVLFGQASREETGSGRGRPLRFYEDTQGRLWLRLLGAGLVQIDLRQRRFLRFAYRPGVLAEGGAVMHERRREPGVLWIGTWSGLHRLDVRTGQVRRYTVRDGLPSDYIYGLLEDVRGRLWISTTNGLSRFDPFAQSFKNFGPEHGLPAREFNEGAFAVAPDGQLFFGSIAGVSAFDPAELRDNQIPPVVHITGVRLFNRPLTPGPDSPLHQPSGEARRLVLDHDEDVVTFEFVGLEYEAPERVRYRYMLEGFDPSWVGAGTRREATYTNLKPGRYTFRVQAANADGVWSQVGAELTVVVHPPWWRTWWAYLCYVVLVVAGVRAAMRAQRQRIMARERERTERLRVEATEARLDAVGRELAVARRIQQGALPKALPESQGLEYVEVAARMVPAQEVGGDLYDFFWIDEHRLAFAIGDVAGKGVPAALFMAVTRSALRAVALTGLTPGPCMTRVNALLCEEALRGMFVTLFYGVLDVTTGHLAFANAGHNVPLFVPAAGEVTPLPRKPSLALCLRGNATYTELEMQLTPGDSLFLFTDGVTEAANVVRARFGDARLLSTVRSLVGRPPEQQINRVVTAVEMFAGGAPQADDITALAIRLKAKVTVPVAVEPETAEA